MRSLYPIFLDLEDKPCLVVGGGQVAERKVNSLLEVGAVVTVVSPEVTQEISALAGEGRVKHLQEAFREERLEGFSLVIGATDDPHVNRAISEAARRKGIWVNIVDSPAESDFFVPSLVRRGGLTVAISTGGGSPAMAKKVRKELEAILGQEYATILGFLRKLRPEVFASIHEEKDRASLYTQLIESGILSHIKRGEMDEARKEAGEILGRFGLPYKEEYLG